MPVKYVKGKKVKMPYKKKKKKMKSGSRKY